MSRFTIRRLKGDAGRSTRSPWVMRDAERPSFLGQYARHDLAIAAASAKLREERGLVPPFDLDVDEILQAMRARRESYHAHTPSAERPMGIVHHTIDPTFDEILRGTDPRPNTAYVISEDGTLRRGTP